MNTQGPITLPAVWAGMPPALLLSVGIHLVVIFGFLISPASESALNVSNRAVTVLLSKSAFAQKDAVKEAADNQRGLLSGPDFVVTPATTTANNSAANLTDVVPVETTHLTMTSSQTSLSSPPVAARAAAHANYLRQWQTRIERFGNAYYRGLAERYGDGDVRLSVTVSADGSLRQITLLSSSDITALDQAAIDTVQRLSPFTPFPEALAAEISELEIVRTWQFRR